MARRHVVVRGARRKMLWVPTMFTSSTIAGDASMLLASMNAAALALRPFTIVRIHYALFLRSDQAAAEEVQFCSFGMAVVSDEAVAVGVTAIPIPDTEAGSSLFFAHKNIMANAVDLTDTTKPGVYFEVDSKAKRKVSNGQDIVIVAENGTAAGLVLSLAGRILVMTN